MDELSIDVASVVLDGAGDEQRVAAAIRAQTGDALDPETLAQVSSAVIESVRERSEP